MTDKPYRCHLGTCSIGSRFGEDFERDAGFPFDPADPRWSDLDRDGTADWIQLIDASPAGKVLAVTE